MGHRVRRIEFDQPSLKLGRVEVYPCTGCRCAEDKLYLMSFDLYLMSELKWMLFVYFSKLFFFKLVINSIR